ncbi:hypothetical protein BD769DRAFT_1681220 [Suillus cothurnatus]|nr:hypothetical protein BD769DRAFT_1681220 [Suillus cothurnatus]
MASSSFMLNHLLATVTSFIPAISNFIPRTQSSMDQLMRHELLVVPDRLLTEGKWVLWEEGIQGQTSSILNNLILQSSLEIQDINDIKYVKKKTGVMHELS